LLLSELDASKYVQTIDDNDLEIIEDINCEFCLSENINELNICLDCGYISVKQKRNNLIKSNSKIIQ
jgi:hypothetical protein